MSSVVMKLPVNLNIGDWLRTDEIAETVEITTGAVFINGISFPADSTIKVGWIDPPTHTLPENVLIDDEWRWIRPVYNIMRYKDENGDEQYRINGEGPFDPAVQVKTLLEDDGVPA